VYPYRILNIVADIQIAMAKLILKRTSEFNNRMRGIEIFSNNDLLGKISNGETKEFELDPGLNKITAKIDWCGSQAKELDLKDNETKILKVSGYKYGSVIPPIGLLISVIYLVLSFGFNIEFYSILILFPIVFLYPIYFITLGKQKYLRITEIS
jgi:hypothetical protein